MLLAKIGVKDESSIRYSSRSTMAWERTIDEHIDGTRK